MTKKEKSMVKSYEYACNRGLSSVLTAYGKPSSAKIEAEEKIKKEMEERDGWGYYICGRNSNFFSCAYKYRDGEGNEWLAFYTYANRFEIKLEEDEKE